MSITELTLFVYSLFTLLALFIGPIVFTKLWDRYVRGINKDNTNSGAKFG